MNVFIHDNEIHSQLSLINTYLFLDKWYILDESLVDVILQVDYIIYIFMM